jgi:acetyl/propionyl-CoA carboxylase alpha subunit
MRVVHDEDDLAEAVAAAKREAAGAFGDDRVFLERFVEQPRHIEVQVIGDEHGTLLHLFERECSIQRRHQKVIEETPSPALDDDLRQRICRAAVAAARAIDYTNAGTVEFVFDDRAAAAGESLPFAFLEMNTRLQVEHPVTEAITGLDLVRLQLLVAQGEPLPFDQDGVKRTGHAIEVRLYAEDPANDYLPATGTLHAFDPPEIESVRWDTGVERGSVISTFYDPMLAKVIAHAPSRPEAANLLARSLERTLIQGVVTNRDLLVAILRDDRFLSGDTTTRYLEERFPTHDDRSFPPDRDTADLTAIVATVAATATASAGVLASVPRGFSNVGLGPETTTYTVAGREVTVGLVANRDGSFDAHLDRTVRHVARISTDGVLVSCEVDGHRLHARVDDSHGSVQVVLPGANVTLFRHPRFPRLTVSDDPGATLAPMPGSVVTVAVSEGQTVAAGDLLAVVEAMKMEHRITAPIAGTVVSVRVSAGQQVDADDVLVVVHDEAQAEAGQAAEAG